MKWRSVTAECTGSRPASDSLGDSVRRRKEFATPPPAQLTEQPLSARPPSRTIGLRQRLVLAFRPQVQDRAGSAPVSVTDGPLFSAH